MPSINQEPQRAMECERLIPQVSHTLQYPPQSLGVRR